MTTYSEAVTAGSYIEWLSDKHFEKGPCTGRIAWILDDVACIDFGGDFVHLKFSEIPFTRVGLHHNGSPLFFVE